MYSEVAVSVPNLLRNWQTKAAQNCVHVSCLIFNVVYHVGLLRFLRDRYGFYLRTLWCIFKRMFNYGYCQQLYCVNNNQTLSRFMLNKQSCIHQLLPSETSSHMHLIPIGLYNRAYSFSLPQCSGIKTPLLLGYFFQMHTRNCMLFLFNL